MYKIGKLIVKKFKSHSNPKKDIAWFYLEPDNGVQSIMQSLRGEWDDYSYHVIERDYGFDVAEDIQKQCEDILKI